MGCQLAALDAMRNIDQLCVDGGLASKSPLFAYDKSVDVLDLAAAALLPVLQNRHFGGGQGPAGQNCVDQRGRVMVRVIGTIR